jgi:hypothetical protein
MNVRSSRSKAKLITACMFLVALSITASCRASNDEPPSDAQSIAQLELRASQAGPREQCYLYVQLIHSMTEAAGKQVLNGEYEQAAATMKKTEHYAQLIHDGLARDTKRLKDAEKLMEHTTARLNEYLRHSSGDDRLAMEATLKRLDGVHDELLTQVFSH